MFEKVKAFFKKAFKRTGAAVKTVESVAKRVWDDCAETICTDKSKSVYAEVVNHYKRNRAAGLSVVASILELVSTAAPHVSNMVREVLWRVVAVVCVVPVAVVYTVIVSLIVFFTVLFVENADTDAVSGKYTFSESSVGTLINLFLVAAIYVCVALSLAVCLVYSLFIALPVSVINFIFVMLSRQMSAMDRAHSHLAPQHI